MRRYAGLYIFCAVLTFVCSGASLAVDGAAEYRAPVTGVKLGPVQAAVGVAGDDIGEGAAAVDPEVPRRHGALPAAVAPWQ